MPLYPLTFTPVLKDYIWGGRTLERLGRSLPPGITAESWEISGHEDGTTFVANGLHAGKSLTQLHAELGLDLIGTNNGWAQERNKFPLLIKLLDAHRPLSVQVHPNDDYALAHEGNELGKTEMWVVLHAEQNAKIQLGLRPGTTPELFRQGVRDGNLDRFLHYIPVKTGDHICLPAGSLHAIMGGILIAEIQQNSNTTYRVFDWNRDVADGKPRPLHVDKAMDVINFQQITPTLPSSCLVADDGRVRRSTLCRNRYFVTERVEMQAGGRYSGVCDGSTLEIWGCITGHVEIEHTPAPAIQFVLLPAALGPFIVTAVENSTLLRTYVDKES